MFVIVTNFKQLKKMATSKTSPRKPENLKKMHIIELKEILDREEALLKNKSLINKLPDNGESIIKFHKLVKNEIKYREDLSSIECTIASLRMSEADKHTQKLCELEKNPIKERYKPSSTLNQHKEIHTDRKVFKTMEDWSKCNKPTQLIPLVESMDILKQQDGRLKEEQVKIKHRLIARQLENEECDDTESGISDAESISETESS